MRRGIIAIAVLSMGSLVGSVGCSSPEPTVTTQLEFDLTVNADRAQFKEQGLAYQGSVGPYAVYKVTAANPSLIGPYIKVDQAVGYAMLCGATHYFTQSLQVAQIANMHLLGGHTGNIPLVVTAQNPLLEGACTQAKDSYGNPIPPGTTGSGSTGAGTTGSGNTGAGNTGSGTNTGGTAGGTTGTPGAGGTGGVPCTNPDGCGTTGSGTTTGTAGSGTTGSGTAGGGTTTGTPTGTGTGTVPCTSPDGCNPDSTSGTGAPIFTNPTLSNDPLIQSLTVNFGANPPQVGSTVLLRRVALSGARVHNLSHLIPNICCQGAQCSLQQ